MNGDPSIFCPILEEHNTASNYFINDRPKEWLKDGVWSKKNLVFHCRTFCLVVLHIVKLETWSYTQNITMAHCKSLKSVKIVKIFKSPQSITAHRRWMKKNMLMLVLNVVMSECCGWQPASLVTRLRTTQSAATLPHVKSDYYHPQQFSQLHNQQCQSLLRQYKSIWAKAMNWRRKELSSN